MYGISTYIWLIFMVNVPYMDAIGIINGVLQGPSPYQWPKINGELELFHPHKWSYNPQYS